MYLFNNHENGLIRQNLPSVGGAIPVAGNLFNALTGEEKPDTMAGLMLVLVLLLHIWAALWLLQPSEPSITPAQPLMMEVSMVNAPHPQPIVTPPAPPKPPEPKKPPVKKPVKKIAQVTPKQAALPKPVTASDAAPPAPSPVVDTSTAVSEAAPAKTAAKPEYTEANFKANYGINPKPNYPALARSRGWQGKVLLRVNVSADGRSESVEIHQSSGHDTLDEAAVEAVEKWKFIPAKRGDTAVACTVIVPINFTLDN